MKPTAVIFLLVAAHAAADAPPLPYAAASSSVASPSFPSTFSGHNEELQPATGAYVQQYGHGAEGFNIQSGFEGYLVPSTSHNAAVYVPIRDSLEYLSSTTGISRVVNFISGKGLKIIPKILLSVVGVAGLLLLGCVATTAVCTFTPLCNISFHGWGVARESMRSFLTEDRISATAAFVTEAIRKYQELYGSEGGSNRREKQEKET